MAKSSNPALREQIFYDNLVAGTPEPMTIHGTIDKCLILLGIVIISAALTWNFSPLSPGLLILLVFGGFGVAILTILKPTLAAYTSPFYAALEGAVLSSISFMMNAQYPGIVSQAVILTFGVFFLLLLVFRTRLIKVTETFKLVVLGSTGAIALLYIVNIVLTMFNLPIGFITEGGILGIGFSLFVVVIASLNLIVDFDYIEKGAGQGLPRYVEWYAAFALIITLIWLYLEILRLLGKARR
jgi:uncharacterized YccA/Bax inhibitor family protein